MELPTGRSPGREARLRYDTGDYFISIRDAVFDLDPRE